MLDYEKRQLEKACKRMGGEFVDGKCIVNKATPEIKKHFNYNGWHNWETWHTKLFLDDNEDIRWRIMDIVQECGEEVDKDIRTGIIVGNRKGAIVSCVADRLHDYLDDIRIKHEDKLPQLFKGLLDSAWEEIDWWEIAETYVEEEGLR